MVNKKKKAKKPDNLSIKGSFDDVIGVTVGVLPNNITNTKHPTKKEDKKRK